MTTARADYCTEGSPPMVWHADSTGRVLEYLDSGPDGLGSGAARSRLEEYGYNRLATQNQSSAWRLLLSQFKNVLILILLAATVLSGLLGHGIEAVAISVIVLFAVLLGFLQEFRAEKALEALSELTAPTARVLRDGTEVAVPAAELVPGDVCLLAAGDRVPADARLLQTANLRVEEASLTGESVPSEKTESFLAAEDASLGDRRNMIFAGTSVSNGRGRAVVVATGMHTELGKIAGMLQDIGIVTENPFKNKWLNRALLVEVFLLGLLLYVPFLQNVFGTFGFTLREWVYILVTAASIIPVIEAAKWVNRRILPAQDR